MATIDTRACAAPGSPRAPRSAGPTTRKIASDRRERELEAGIEERVRAPGEQDGGRDEQDVPRVALARDEPGDRDGDAGDRGPDHGRLRADGEHVGDDRGDRRHVRPARAAARQATRAASTPDREQHDVLARDGEQVVEPGAPEARLQLVVRGRRRRRARPLRGPRGVLPSGRARTSGAARRAGGRRRRRGRRAGRRACHSSTCRTTWTPCRRSQVRSSKPCCRPARRARRPRAG